MNDWYYIIGGISYGIFIIQFLSTWLLGDIDLDIDCDGNIDFGISDIVSFKGLVHFAMGFSGWLMTKSIVSTVTWYDYIISVGCGILFMVILYYLYKFCLRFESISNEFDNLVGKSAKIYIIYEDQYYLIISGIFDSIRGYPLDETKKYHIGETVTIKEFKDNKYYF